MKPGDDLYSMEDLESAVQDLSHHKGMLKDVQNQLKSKRDAIKSFEESEAQAQLKVDESEARVRRIASHLRK